VNSNCLIIVNQFISHCSFLKHVVIESDLPELTSLFQRRCLMYKIQSIFAWHMYTVEFANDQQAKTIYSYEKTMEKLYKTCVTVWYTKA